MSLIALVHAITWTDAAGARTPDARRRAWRERTRSARGWSRARARRCEAHLHERNVAAWIERRPALRTLVEYSARAERHAVTIADQRAVIDIGFLDNTQDQIFMAYLYGALREGSVAQINAGTIYGPKVLALLVRLKRVVPEGVTTKVVGRVSAETLDSAVNASGTYIDKVTGIRTEMTEDVREALRSQAGISTSDLREYRDALERLGITKACLRLYRAVRLQLCGEMGFEMDAHRPEDVRWSLP